MKSTSCLGVFFAIIAFCFSSTGGADSPCDCTKFPFEPNPPCASVCIAEYLAIASLDDLRNIVGLPEDAAKMIASIPPNKRPHSVEDYKNIISASGYQILERRIASLTAQDFGRIAISASRRGESLDALKW
jgi:hypothetical protein